MVTKFAAGDEVIVRGTDWVGEVIKQRIEGEEMYLVNFERYFSGSKLQLMSEADAEMKALQPSPLWAPEKLEELEKLTDLLKETYPDGKIVTLSEPILQSMRALGLIKEKS
jgi:hypothetical protein